MNRFEGDQVPQEIESLEETNISNEEIFNKYDEYSDNNIYESDESDNDIVPIMMISDLKII